MNRSSNFFQLISISTILILSGFLNGTSTALALLSPVRQPSLALSQTDLKQTKIPFVVQQLKNQPVKDDADQISSIVISVFFQEEAEMLPENRSMGSITKPLILAYLKNLQFGDVRGKKFMLGSGINNSMFVARRVIPANEMSSDPSDTNLSLEELASISSIGSTQGNIYNKDQLSPSKMGYTAGDILGYVDVTEKNFGLPGDTSSGDKTAVDNTDGETITSGENILFQGKSAKKSLRPVLTNLSVKQEARCSGVGSALVDACESVVMDTSEWSRSYYEMVLEVEDENEAAQTFYEKRAYTALYSDPSSRRYDTSGLLLSNVRTTKICYRKDLTKKGAARTLKGGNGNGGVGIFFAKVRQVMGI